MEMKYNWMGVFNMFEVKQEGARIIIDVREMVKKGMHPRKEIMDTVLQAAKGSIFEIHLPHPGQPLVASLKQFGIDCIINEVEPGHFRLLALKLS
jgi:hypothetical protein